MNDSRSSTPQLRIVDSHRSWTVLDARDGLIYATFPPFMDDNYRHAFKSELLILVRRAYADRMSVGLIVDTRSCVRSAQEGDAHRQIFDELQRIYDAHPSALAGVAYLTDSLALSLITNLFNALPGMRHAPPERWCLRVGDGVRWLYMRVARATHESAK